MKITELYQRPDICSIKSTIKKDIIYLSNIDEFDVYMGKIKKIIEQINYIEDNFLITFYNRLRDINDKKNNIEYDYFNNHISQINDIKSNFYEEILYSKFRSSIKDIYGERIFFIAKNFLEINRSELLFLKKEEMKLIDRYCCISVEINDAIKALSEYTLSDEYKIRSKYIGYINILYSKLVEIRIKEAMLLNEENYISLAYKKLNRFDYTNSNIKKFRKYIKKHIIPLCRELNSYKVNNTSKYDIDSFFYFADDIVSKMPQYINDIYLYIKENKLYDLNKKQNKTNGGFCVFLENLNLPYILTNNNGNFEDFEIFFHEFGHVLQHILSTHIFREYNEPSMELGEIPSTMMELYSVIFLNKNIQSYIKNTVTFLLYASVVDEFQEYIYSNDKLSEQQIEIKWYELLCEYNIENKQFYSSEFPHSWQKQGHIIISPFYYIDYAIAIIISFNIILSNSLEDSFDFFTRICKTGGKYGFIDTIEHLNVDSPFVESSLILFKNNIRLLLKGEYKIESI